MMSNRFLGSPRKGLIPACLLVGALAMTVLAGCIQPSDDPDVRPGELHAVLEVDREERWTQEAFTLDGRNSSVPDEGAVHWVFDLGDGTTKEGTNMSRALVQHEYDRGGAYEVTLTITLRQERDEATATDSDPQNESRDMTKRVLVVNERQQLRERFVFAAPFDDRPELLNETPVERMVVPFTAHENASSWEADVRLENQALIGQSELTVRVLDEKNRTLAEEEVTLDQDENWTVRLDGLVEEPGQFRLEILVDSGGVKVDGQIRVYYEAPEM